MLELRFKIQKVSVKVELDTNAEEIPIFLTESEINEILESIPYLKRIIDAEVGGSIEIIFNQETIYQRILGSINMRDMTVMETLDWLFNDNKNEF